MGKHDIPQVGMKVHMTGLENHMGKTQKKSKNYDAIE